MKKSFEEFKEFIKDKKTAVVGIGISNTPLIKFLTRLGAKVVAFDRKDENSLGDITKELEGLGVKLILGEEYLSKLSGFEVIFKTPSLRIDSPALIKAKSEGAYITSEMEEFIKYCPAKIYGVTGSDGKTTTTTLIYNILKEEGFNTWVGGNIGTPLFTRIEEVKPQDRVVVELSSFQLMTMEVSPEVAVVTNISPNHLDIHKGFAEYVEAKKNIYRYQDNKGKLILNYDNSFTREMAKEAKGEVLFFSTAEETPESILNGGAYYRADRLFVAGIDVCSRDFLTLMGMHNVENLLAAFSATYSDVSIESIRKVATTMKPVEHRMEFIREINGVKYYNDSIATSPTRTLAGLKAFSKPVILIAGGYDKKLPFDVLAKEGISRIKALILSGKTRDIIKAAFEKEMAETGIILPIYMVNDLEEAVEKAKAISEDKDVVTLSPACASFDAYANFEARGNKFKDLVRGL